MFRPPQKREVMTDEAVPRLDRLPKPRQNRRPATVLIPPHAVRMHDILDGPVAPLCRSEIRPYRVR